MSAPDLKDVIAGHASRNRELCKLIESKGADLAAKRPIDFHFWADGELAAHRLADAIRERGWSHVELDRREDGGVWNVEVHVEASVTEIADPGLTEEFAREKLTFRSEGKDSPMFNSQHTPMTL